MQDNNVGAAPYSPYRGDVWALFDKLPAPIRRALQDSVIDWDPRAEHLALQRLKKNGFDEAVATKLVCLGLARADELEVREFGQYWPARYGAYPAVAAQASILRYDEAERHGRARRRRRSPVSVVPTVVQS